MALACAGCNRGGRGLVFYGSGEAGSQKTSYLAETVTRGDIENAITAVGTLSALRSINVGAQVSGQLKSVKVEVGDQVKQGQLIAEIDPSPFEKKVEIASAQLDNLKAQLLSKQAQLTLKRPMQRVSARFWPRAAYRSPPSTKPTPTSPWPMRM